MAKYTLNLSEVCEQVTGLRFNDLTGMAFDRVDTIANAAIPELFSTRYTVLDDADDANDLYRMILEHYWEYEVCTYTPSDFILRLNRKLNEIMPYYNQRYESTKLQFPVFEDVDYTDDGTDTATNNTVEDATGNTTHSGTDRVISQESGTTGFTGTDVSTDNGHSLIHNALGEDYHADASNQGKQTDWDYNNNTPQGSISGITEEDYLSSYSKRTTEFEKGQTGKFDPEGKFQGFGNTEMEIKPNSFSGDHASHGSSAYANTYKDDTQGQQTDTHNNTTSHGKGVSTDTIHGHKIDTKDDKTTDFEHEGDYHKHIKGKANSGKSYSQMLQEYRATMINIYTEIIEELHELFFLIY